MFDSLAALSISMASLQLQYNQDIFYLLSTSNRKHNPKSFDYIIKEIKYKDIFLLDSIKYVYSMHYIHWVKYEGKYF